MGGHQRGAVVVVCSLLAVVAAVGSGCDPGCPYGQRRAEVQGGGDGYVCIPDATAQSGGDKASTRLPSTSTPFPSSTNTAQPTPPTPLPPPPPTCETLSAPSTSDVLVIVRSGEPVATEPSPAPPDGEYVLAQASVYASDPSGSPLDKVRATLSVSKAKLIFGGQATVNRSLELNESFTFSVVPSGIVRICETRSGSLSSLWFPGAEGITRPARVGWDVMTEILTLVVTTPFGEIELLFVPR